MSVLQCPRCNKEVFARPLKTWRFHGYSVKRYECPYCKLRFNLYSGGGKTFTIPKPK